MNAGVAIGPCAVVITPARALAPWRAVISKPASARPGTDAGAGSGLGSASAVVTASSCHARAHRGGLGRPSPWDHVQVRSGETMMRLWGVQPLDRKSTRLNSSHVAISYAV